MPCGSLKARGRPGVRWRAVVGGPGCARVRPPAWTSMMVAPAAVLSRSLALPFPRFAR